MEANINVTPGMIKTFMLIAGIKSADTEGVTSLRVTVESNNNQTIKISKKMKGNTAKSLDQIFSEMSAANTYAAADALLLSANELKTHYEFLEDLYGKCVTGSEEQKVIEKDMHDILSIMSSRIQLTKNFVQAQTSPINVEAIAGDNSNKSVAKIKDVKVIEFKPDKDSPAAKSEKKESEATNEPIAFKELQGVVKSLLEEGKEEDARAYATEYLGKANYIPKKPGQKPIEWEENRISGWMNHLKTAVNDAKRKAETKPNDNSDITPITEDSSKVTESESKDPADNLSVHRKMVSLRDNMVEGSIHANIDNSSLTDEEKEVEKLVFKYDYKIISEGFATPPDTRFKLLNFSLPEKTLSDEIKKLDHLATKYLELIKMKDSNEPTEEELENVEIANGMVKLFFKHRGYKPEQIGYWTTGVKNAGTNDGLKEMNHFALLGVPRMFFEGETLAECKMSYKDIKESILDEEKVQGIKDAIAGTLVNVDGTFVQVYTDLHADNFIKEHTELVKKEIAAKEQEEAENAVDTYPLGDFELLIETAVKSNVSLEDFMHDHKELLMKPNGEWRDLTDGDKETIAIDNEEMLKAWAEERHQVYKAEYDAELQNQKDNGTVSEEKDEAVDTIPEGDGEDNESGSEEKAAANGEVRVEYDKEDRIEIFHSVMDEKVLSYETFDELCQDDLIKDMLENGVVINAFDDPNHKGKEVIFYSSDKGSAKEFKNWLRAYHVKLHNENKEETPKISAVDTFEDGSVRIHSFSQLQDQGFELFVDKEKGELFEGKTREDFIAWVAKNILNRKLDDQPDDSTVITDENMPKNIVEHMFGIKENQPEVTMTEDQIELALIPMLKDKDVSLLTASKAYKDMTVKLGAEISLSKAFDYVKTKAEEHCPDKLKTLMERAEANRSRKIFVEEKFSTKNPEDWEKLKGISTMQELHNSCKVYKDKDQWQTALALALEVVKQGNIPDTESWDKEKVKQWFNDTIMTDPTDTKSTVSEKKPDKTETIEIEPEYEEVANASNPQKFKKAIFEILKNAEDQKIARAKVINAIKNGKGKHTKKVSKMPEGDMHKMLNNTLEKVEKASASE
jgi:hypothetical protein